MIPNLRIEKEVRPKMDGTRSVTYWVIGDDRVCEAYSTMEDAEMAFEFHINNKINIEILKSTKTKDHDN